MPKKIASENQSLKQTSKEIKPKKRFADHGHFALNRIKSLYRSTSSSRAQRPLEA